MLTAAQSLDYELSLREFLQKTRLTPALQDFAIRNRTVMKLVRYTRYHGSASTETCSGQVYAIWRYSEWLKQEPDRILEECWDLEGTPLPKMLAKHSDLVGDDFYSHLLNQGVADGTAALYAKHVKSLYAANKLPLSTTRFSKIVLHPTRALTPEELEKVLAVADLREKTIVSLLALCGFRLSTLARLKYHHVAADLETGRVPFTFRIRANQTKGAYTPEYFTFARAEAAEYLRLYIAARKQGTEKLPPESLSEDSPLIRDSRTQKVKPLTPVALWRIITNLFRKSNLIMPGPRSQRTGPTPRGPQKRYDLRPHSLRYFFRTQLASLGVSPEYCEFMLGHKGPLYNDVRSKGPEFLRNLYERSCISIRQRTKTSQLDQLKAVVRGFGYDPEKILVKEALAEPHRIIVPPEEDTGLQTYTLTNFLRRTVLQELKNASEGSGNINAGQFLTKVK